MDEIGYELINSWVNYEGINSTENILDWINERNSDINVQIKRINLSDSDFWYYDGEVIKNKKNSFFSISGIQQFQDNELIDEQPIIIQQEIGFLGIICKKINGVLHFLMQAKIEPGNINKVQISPTIQATKSNFTQKHGGEKPKFLKYFMEASSYQTIVDQIQSEQASRFFEKRNRNVVLLINEDIPQSNNHKWMTLGQIKKLMKYNNLVNMDTRTVLSCIPYTNLNKNVTNEFINLSKDRFLLNSLSDKVNNNDLIKVFSNFNSYKMFNNNKVHLVDLFSLKDWYMEGNTFKSKKPAAFDIIFCSISIGGREVKSWDQPLLAANGKAIFGLLTHIKNGKRKFLTKVSPEIGCFDSIELGPTVQNEPNESQSDDVITKMFDKKLKSRKGILIDVLLSEEGGRFYHEQNQNVIIEIDIEEIPEILPNGYFWLDYKTLNTLVQTNNCLNIQLRNLISLLEV